MNEPPDWSRLAPHWDPAKATPGDAQAAGDELDAAERTAERVAGGGIRAAVLGGNDGLVTNLCLILGVVGAATPAATVRLTGLMSLLAGALSMAAGEWVSVRSQLEVAESMDGALRRAWEHSPPVVFARFARALRGFGLDRRTARQAEEQVALGDEPVTVAGRVIFGVTPDTTGSPMTAAVSSFVLFAVGAFIPLVPWFFTEGVTAVVLSAALTGTASLLVGGYLAGQSDRPVWAGALRQLAIVAGASAVTYVLGMLAGTSV
ncbi:VIT1/CCC1 family predicted Fe2+/Mn2+ transporter [Actinocorallia herbida]|uniref:VIT1/CCC1 family predicted Fe2+/Mn2+ transporter n=1 Tax=Actinocorallia herbida TaxID=58109 RepID=A0A3N1D6Q6_9ACTN|nr:VIT1/CCC1 transporter family protein [Actinocorallia herbida]ROO89210.1 VIT1/CCC1 family predicted Fe2+/Mn2+ transporter [Actinocorallia herbida]